MRLDNIKIRRLRGINEGEISGLVDVNILIGRNNCGKSTVAEAISYLAYSTGGSPPSDGQGSDRRNALLDVRRVWSDVRHESYDPKAGMWFHNNTGRPIEIYGTLSADGELVRPFGSSITLADHRIKLIHCENSYSASDAILLQTLKFMPGIMVFRPSDGANKRIEESLWRQLLATRKEDKSLTALVNEIFGTDVEALHVVPGRRQQQPTRNATCLP